MSYGANLLRGLASWARPWSPTDAGSANTRSLRQIRMMRTRPSRPAPGRWDDPRPDLAADELKAVGDDVARGAVSE
jgi:hypothetical protein